MALPDVAQGEIAEPRSWLETNAAAVSGVVTLVARRHRLSPQDTDELISAVFAHLVQNDYRVLRRYRGTARISTYLSVVTARVLLDSRRKAWGKWRPTAQRLRAG